MEKMLKKVISLVLIILGVFVLSRGFYCIPLCMPGSCSCEPIFQYMAVAGGVIIMLIGLWIFKRK